MSEEGVLHRGVGSIMELLSAEVGVRVEASWR